jgi:hypothetical protein
MNSIYSEGLWVWLQRGVSTSSARREALQRQLWKSHERDFVEPGHR